MARRKKSANLWRSTKTYSPNVREDEIIQKLTKAYLKTKEARTVRQVAAIEAEVREVLERDLNPILRDS